MNDFVKTFDNRDTAYIDELQRARREEQRFEPSAKSVPSAETEALGQMLMEAINREVAIRAQLIEVRRRLVHEET